MWKWTITFIMSLGFIIFGLAYSVKWLGSQIKDGIDTNNGVMVKSQVRVEPEIELITKGMEVVDTLYVYKFKI